MKELNLDRILTEVLEEVGPGASTELVEQEFLTAVAEEAREVFRAERKGVKGGLGENVSR